MMLSIKTNINTYIYSVLMNTNSYNRVTEEDQPQLKVDIHFKTSGIYKHSIFALL